MNIRLRSTALAAVVVVAVALAGMHPSTRTPAAEADLGAPGGISALPSAMPGFPGIADQSLPAIIPATEPGRGASNKSVVTVFCDPAATLPFATGPCQNPIAFVMAQVSGDGSLASTYAATGDDALSCSDNTACDLSSTIGVVAVLVDGGAEDEIVEVTATDGNGESRVVQIIVVDTMLAVGTTPQGSSALISYTCDDTGLRLLTALEATVDPDSDGRAGLDDIFDLLYGFGFGLAVLDNNLLGDVDIPLLQCGGDTSSLFDDFVDFQTDRGMFSIDPLAAAIQQSLFDLFLALGIATPPSLDFDCGEGGNIDTFDVGSLSMWSIFPLFLQLEGGCDLDFAGNGVVTTLLLATGEAGVATVTAQQGGGVSPPRATYVLLSGPPVTVDIDIQPQSDINIINSRRKGAIAVAVLTTATFNAATVDTDTAIFEGAPARWSRMKDVDRDGDKDLLLRFRLRDMGLAPGQTEACLQGQTLDAVPLQGCDSIQWR